MNKKGKIILGIDPGTVIMGYSVISVDGNAIQLLEMDVVKLNGKKDMFERLGEINQVIHKLINQYNPSEMAIEAPFFGKNVQSMLKLGRAQGIAIGVAMTHQLNVSEYSPKKVKQSITGNGNANKEQIWKMLNNIIVIKQAIKYYDASDALAVAICHHFSLQGIKLTSLPKKSPKKSTSSSWDSFIKENPDRIKK
ncbi:MAG: crossover junction endodeoxyribonuclease RuvC [Chitinophagaceae bacterium]|nr:MAG: crossover junction endodeoxyribonuclease RuvC [Chitinophagaceae bacterium]